MNKFCLTTTKLCPLLSLLFSLITVGATVAINERGMPPIFFFFSAQVYLNWISIKRISRASVTLGISDNGNSEQARNNHFDIRIDMQPNNRTAAFRTAENTTSDKFWYCEKCALYTRRPSRHCELCKRCFHHRDHHCFFIGGCILRQNMGNFILICIYTALTSIYSLTIIGPYLYEHLDHFLGDNSSAFDIILNFSFPIALARLIFSRQESCIVLVSLFDALFSVSCICLAYGSWKLYACLTGRQRYYPHKAKREDLAEIFGSYGLGNFIFPINGLFGAKTLKHKCDLLKEI